MDTLEFKLLKAHITAELSDVEHLKVLPYAGQDMPNSKGEPLISCPAILIKRRQPVNWKALGKGLKMADVTFDFTVIVKNVLSQEDRLLAENPGLDALAKRLDAVLDGVYLRKGLLPEYAQTPEADTVVINSMTLTQETDPIGFSALQKKTLSYVALCYSTNTYQEPLHPTNVTIEISTGFTTSITEV